MVAATANPVAAVQTLWALIDPDQPHPDGCNLCLWVQELRSCPVWGPEAFPRLCCKHAFLCSRPCLQPCLLDGPLGLML